MGQLTITAKGQVTLRKEVLRHLGVSAGDRIEVEFRGDHQIGLRPVRGGASLEELGAVLNGKGNGKRVSLAEMNRVGAAGWAGLADREPR